MYKATLQRVIKVYKHNTSQIYNVHSIYIMTLLCKAVVSTPSPGIRNPVW